MRNDHTEIRSTVTFDLLATPTVPVDVELRYHTEDPYAVTTLFNPDGARPVEWVFSRDLLADGLVSSAGEGDVRIWPAGDDHDVVVLEFTTPAGYARFEADAQELADFLNHTYDVIAPGSEHEWFDFEHELTRMISAK